ncbi:glycosyltransferase family 4 protein [Pisolithus marmoratus]|nr:glycosyltransferase family 4 protein [Pisolithus marmoratus]
MEDQGVTRELTVTWGAERLVVDAALGLQAVGHAVDVYTSRHDEKHCFDGTQDGTLRVHHVVPSFPRSWRGKFHILFAHARQLHLTKFLLSSCIDEHDVFFVDQLSTCIPLLRLLGGKRVVFYCHFPDKLLANGAFVEGKMQKRNVGIMKRIYRYPMDWLEEMTTSTLKLLFLPSGRAHDIHIRQADVILANSKFTARVMMAHFSSLKTTPKVVYPGINIHAYEASVDMTDLDIVQVASPRPTLLSLNRFEMKKNAALAVEAFSCLRGRPTVPNRMRLVLAGGYDPRLEDNIRTLNNLIDLARMHNLTFKLITSSKSSARVPSFPDATSHTEPDILFLLNFTTGQRSALLQARSTVALLYTPANEHFGIGAVEGMICGLPVLACDSGGPTESIVDTPSSERTGWLRSPDPGIWASVLEEIFQLSEVEGAALVCRCKDRARSMFEMEEMAEAMDVPLREAVDMGAVRAPVKEIGFVLAFVFGLILAILFRV